MNAHLRISVVSLAALALAAGCSGNKGTPDSGSDAGQGDGGNLNNGHHDGGSGDGGGGGDAGMDAGPAGCQADADCLSTGRRCAPDGGCTLPAQPCDPAQGSSNCSVSASYCWTDGINTTNNCYCDTLPAGVGDAGGPGGVCYVQIPPCGPCVNQIDCGPTGQVDNPGYCGPVGNLGTFCLPTDQTGACPPAFVPGSVDNTDVCVPSCGVCPCAPCANNDDCPLPASGVCKVANGVCEPPCQQQTDCPGGEVCNVLGKYLDPSTGIYYAGGQCGPACAQPSDCAVYQGDAGLAYFCDLDGGAYCRPTACLEDSECLQSGLTTQTIIAWCDIWDGNVCTASACRIGEDAQTAGSYNDCLGGYTCDAGGATPTDGGPPVLGGCVAVPCNQIPGGAHDACSAGQFCCGEGDAGTAACGSASVGQCYQAPHPPWCVPCDPSNGASDNPACAGLNDGYPGAPQCLTARGLGNPPSWCGPPCDPAQLWSCPAGWECVQTMDGGGYNCVTRSGCPDAG